MIGSCKSICEIFHSPSNRILTFLKCSSFSVKFRISPSQSSTTPPSPNPGLSLKSRKVKPPRSGASRSVEHRSTAAKCRPAPPKPPPLPRALSARLRRWRPLARGRAHFGGRLAMSIVMLAAEVGSELGLVTWAMALRATSKRRY